MIGGAGKDEVSTCEPRRCVLQRFRHSLPPLPFARSRSIGRPSTSVIRSSVPSRISAEERVVIHLRPGFMTPRYELYPAKKYSIR